MTYWYAGGGDAADSGWARRALMGVIRSRDHALAATVLGTMAERVVNNSSYACRYFQKTSAEQTKCLKDN